MYSLVHSWESNSFLYSLLLNDFYILLLIMVSPMFYISLVFKSCTFYVLVQFWYQLSFTTLCPLSQVSSPVLVLQELFPVSKLGQWKGQHSTYTEAIVPFQPFLYPILIQPVSESCKVHYKLNKIFRSRYFCKSGNCLTTAVSLSKASHVR